MNLAELLAEDLVVWMNAVPDGVPRRVLLWLDPESTFIRMFAPVSRALAVQHVRLLRLEPPGGPTRPSRPAPLASCSPGRPFPALAAAS